MSVELKRTCASADEARRLAAAVSVDDPSHVSVVAEGEALFVRVAAASAGSVRATLDDLLACLAAAEGAARAPGPSTRRA